MDEPNWGRHVPRDVAALVDQQIRRWTLNDQHRASTGATDKNAAIHWPVVTISREYGTKGSELGKRVAQRLGFTCWDREIVVRIAEKLRINESSIAPLDERAYSAFEELMGVTLFGQAAMCADYHDQLRWLVATIERRGGAVIVGRGAHCIVSPQNALRVRVVAPLEQRVADIRQRKGVDEKAALNLIRASDKDRAGFLRREFGSDVNDSRNYDITINTASFEPERADAVVLTAYLIKFGQLPAATREELDARRAATGTDAMNAPAP